MNPTLLNWFRLATVQAVVLTVLMVIFIGVGGTNDTTERMAWVAVAGYIIGFSGEIADTFLDGLRAARDRKAA